MLISDLAMITGNIGRRGVGVNPLRGQNNVQGAADMGCPAPPGSRVHGLHDPEINKNMHCTTRPEIPTRKGLKIPEMCTMQPSKENSKHFG